jgi:hypothetical protein
MDLVRDENGTWRLLNISSDEQGRKPDYIEALPRYLTAFDALFERAREASEFDFIHSLLGIRGLQDAGWVPYETTLEAISALVEICNGINAFAPSRHLKLWIYGHIVEASEPYELLGNMLAIVKGDRFRIARFPSKRSPSPSEKIQAITAASQTAGFASVAVPLNEAWDRDLRNAVFHADYALHGVEVRLPGIGTRAHDEIEQLVARATAYHDALAQLRAAHIASYTEPKSIPAPQGFSADLTARAIVIVREGHGVIGLKDGYPAAELAHGAIRWRLAVLMPGEAEELDADPSLARLPSRDRVRGEVA